MGQCMSRPDNSQRFRTSNSNRTPAGATSGATSEATSAAPSATPPPTIPLPPPKALGNVNAVSTVPEGEKTLNLSTVGNVSMASTPSSVATLDLTTVYKVPNEKYQTIDDIMTEKGYTIVKKVDEGGFAKVYLMQRGSSDKYLACKIIVIGTDNGSTTLRDAKNELWMMRRIKHPHVVCLYDHFIVNDSLFMIMQYASGGNLFQLLCHMVFTESQSKTPFAQIVSAVGFMHGYGIAHRDLKLSNFLLDIDCKGSVRCIHILVADFGLSRVVYRRQKGLRMCQSFCGTSNYMAPELKKRMRYNAFLADVYSLGVVLFYMLHGKYPLDPIDDDKALKEALNLQLDWTDSVPVSSEYRALVEGLMQPKEGDRIQMEELIHHPWYAREMQTVQSKCPPPRNLPKQTSAGTSTPFDDLRLADSRATSPRGQSSGKATAKVRSPAITVGKKSKRPSNSGKATGTGSKSRSAGNKRVSSVVKTQGRSKKMRKSK